MSLLKSGLHPDASDALRQLGISPIRIMQTIGNAAASAGTHAIDGSVNGHPYCAAVDLRSRDLSEATIKTLLTALGTHGFAAWYRNPGHDHWPASEANHIHAVYAGCPMKLSLRNQVHDYCHGRNGLASHVAYQFFQAPQAAIDMVRQLFLANNPAQRELQLSIPPEGQAFETEPVEDLHADLLGIVEIPIDDAWSRRDHP